MIKNSSKKHLNVLKSSITTWYSFKIFFSILSDWNKTKLHTFDKLTCWLNHKFW